ncbi:P-loop containing nucleoside triphosphate hydrolase protein [Lentinula raphanica]|nr:P-loop containing nucleoside triphosphate hydrolase protein [Lentinula raphanica]
MNVLNKDMQGRWKKSYQTRLNLNSTTTTTTTETPASVEPSKMENTENVRPGADGDGESLSAVNGKRKTKSTGNTTKRQKTATSPPPSSPPQLRLASLVLSPSTHQKLLEYIFLPLLHPEIYTHTGIQPPRGVLFHGPPGCGKTMLAEAVGGEVDWIGRQGGAGGKGVSFIKLSAPEIVSGMSGESERAVREAFAEAKRQAPSILFIDEIDAVTPKRESAQREMERRIVAQFLTCMDELGKPAGGGMVIVIGATNRPDSLDAALRRAGRFDHEIAVGVPDDEEREKILRVLTSHLLLSPSFDFPFLAKSTPGYVGADLASLTSAAGIIAVKRIFGELGRIGNATLNSGAVDMDVQVESIEREPETDKDTMQVDTETTQNDVSTLELIPTHSSNTNDASNPLQSFLLNHPSPLTPSELSSLELTTADFTQALTQIQPSSKREGFATIPDVTWADIGFADDDDDANLTSIRTSLQLSIVHPINHPLLFSSVGISSASGVLLFGPPGCGKTLFAKAVANESQANFISIKGPELLNKYVGESERAVRTVFARARNSMPCVVFFDEIDALVPRRDSSSSSSSETSSSEASSRVVNTLLAELDGLDSQRDSLRSVYVIAASNRPDMVDPAMMRPGRLDKVLFVGMPSGRERVGILRKAVRDVPVGMPGSGSELELAEEDSRVQAMSLIETFVQSPQCDGYTGADMKALVREAGVSALKRTLGMMKPGFGFDYGSGSVSSLQADTAAPTSLATVASTNTSSTQSPKIPKITVTPEDFFLAQKNVYPSVSEEERERYEVLREKMTGMRSASTTTTNMKTRRERERRERV